eukprot:1162013-Pelagomonas_calceolata.AAC.7
MRWSPTWCPQKIGFFPKYRGIPVPSHGPRAIGSSLACASLACASLAMQPNSKRNHFYFR